MDFSVNLKRGEEERQTLLILGDGPLDERVMRLLAPRFDGTNCFLSCPRPPLAVEKGPSAIAALASALTSGYKVVRALFVVDKEHVANFEAISRWLSEYGFRIEECKEKGGVKVLHVVRGPSATKLYVVVAGVEKSMDEELISLAHQVYGKVLGKSEVRQRLEELLSKAGHRQLAMGLPRLYVALKNLEEECR